MQEETVKCNRYGKIVPVYKCMDCEYLSHYYQKEKILFCLYDNEYKDVE